MAVAGSTVYVEEASGLVERDTATGTATATLALVAPGTAFARGADGQLYVGSSVPSGGGTQGRIAAYSGAGAPLWSDTFTLSTSTNVEAVAVAADGRVFVGGRTSNGGAGMGFVRSYAGGGSLRWSSIDPAGGNQDTTDLDVVGATVALSGSTTAASVRHPLVRVLDDGPSAPTTRWQQELASGDASRGRTVLIDGPRVLLGGSVSPVGSTTAEATDGFVASFAAADGTDLGIDVFGAPCPTVCASQSSGNAGRDEVEDLVLDGGGGVEVAGSTAGGWATPIGAAHDGTDATVDVFVRRYDADLVRSWSVELPGDADGFAEARLAATDGRAYVTTLLSDASTVRSSVIGLQDPPTASAPGTATPVRPAPGATVTLTGAGFAPGSPVDAYAYSSPRFLGTTTAGGNGSVTAAFGLPADLPTGHHDLILSGRDPAGALRTTSAPVEVGGPDPVVPEGRPILLLGATALVGGTLVLSRRRPAGGRTRSDQPTAAAGQ